MARKVNLKFLWQFKFTGEDDMHLRIYEVDVDDFYVKYMAVVEGTEKEEYIKRFYYTVKDGKPHPIKPSEGTDEVIEFNNWLETDAGISRREEAVLKMDKLIIMNMRQDPMMEIMGVMSSLGFVRDQFEVFYSYKVTVKDLINNLMEISDMSCRIQ